MERFDYIKAFYKVAHDRSTFVADIDSLLASKPRKLQVMSIPFSTSVRPATAFPAFAGKSRKVRLVESYDGVQLFELKYSFLEDAEKKKAKGKFLVYENPDYPNVFVAVTIEDSDFIRKGLLPFLHSQFPLVVTGFIPHERLKRLLAEFRTNHNFTELIITRASQRIRLPDEGVHRRVIPVTSWPNMALDEAIDWLIEHNGWFQSVQFEAKRDSHTATRVSITREGVVRCDYLYCSVFQSFVLPICKIHHENFNLFSRRGRRDNAGLAARPLAIAFDEGQFDDVAENQKFIRAMRLMPAASISVLHGNPYIHVSTIDYLDGSAFDLWVLDSQELVLVPQMYASVGAIKRLVNHVFDTYAEGEIREYSQGAK